MIRYITELPDKVHHPKEDDHLFVKMRERFTRDSGCARRLHPPAQRRWDQKIRRA